MAYSTTDQIQPNICPSFLSGEGSFERHNIPSLGLGCDLPQNCVISTNTNFSPEQNQYPVLFFCYGTLCDSNILSYLSLTEDRLSVLEPASVSGGILRTWPGKYQALVDKRSECVH
jgi:hypothetical protein